jgi:hypothetical protein
MIYLPIGRFSRTVLISHRMLSASHPSFPNSMWALTANEMKECHWLKPELVAQIEFTEWTPDARLRHASFAGLRDDKERGRLCGNNYFITSEPIDGRFYFHVLPVRKIARRHHRSGNF